MACLHSVCMPDNDRDISVPPERICPKHIRERLYLKLKVLGDGSFSHQAPMLQRIDAFPQRRDRHLEHRARHDALNKSLHAMKRKKRVSSLWRNNANGTASPHPFEALWCVRVARKRRQ